jgi:hypothetical protein
VAVINTFLANNAMQDTTELADLSQNLLDGKLKATPGVSIESFNLPTPGGDPLIP